MSSIRFSTSNIKFIMPGGAHMDVRCSFHPRCFLILSTATAYEQKYLDVLSWLKAGIGVDAVQHQDAADDVKAKHGIDTRRARRRREQQAAAAAASAASAGTTEHVAPHESAHEG